MVVRQYEIYWIDLNPTKGSEVNKKRPCVVISPDEMNLYIKTLIVAPLTHTIKLYPSRVLCSINDENSAIMLDQIRSVYKLRFGRKIGSLDADTIEKVKTVVYKMLC